MIQRRTFLAVGGVGAGLCLAGCTMKPEDGRVDSTQIRADLEALAKARILLGHQSVGRNILEGIETLAKETGVPLRIVEIDGVPPDTAPGLFHTMLGQNGDPDGKCEAFQGLLLRPERPAYDVAMMKFCYVDLGRGAQVEAAEILDRYTRVVETLREQRPEVRIVHVSLPLRSDPPGWKTPIKRLIDRETEEDADNALRTAFNVKLRERFAQEPMFDLAAVESTYPDGGRSSFTRDGARVYTLAGEYTSDGGHLNEIGQRRAAAEFIRTTARALRRPI